MSLARFSEAGLSFWVIRDGVMEEDAFGRLGSLVHVVVVGVACS